MNFGELKLAVADFLHRNDMADRIGTFINVANRRLATDLRCPLNVALTGMEYVGEPFLWPFFVPDMVEIKTMYYETNGRVQQLMPTTVDNILAMPKTGSVAKFYAVSGFVLYIRPEVFTVYQTLYFTSMPPFVNDDDSNIIAENVPQLYIYGALVEAFFFTQDADMLAYAQQQYKSEIQRLNEWENHISVGSVPVMRRV